MGFACHIEVEEHCTSLEAYSRHHVLMDQTTHAYFLGVLWAHWARIPKYLTNLILRGRNNLAV